MAINNPINSGQTLASTSDVTFDSITFSATTKGIVGTTTNNSAASSYVGEFVTSVIPLASAISLTSLTVANVTTISLTAGDWDIWGNVGFTGGASTTVLALFGWVSSANATLPDASLYSSVISNPASTLFAVSPVCFSVPGQQFKLSGTTTIYLSVDASFAVSTGTAFGGIYARRRR